MRKDQYQKQAYGLRRVSLAVDRVLRTDAHDEKNRLAKWVNAWALIAKIKGREKLQ